MNTETPPTHDELVEKLERSVASRYFGYPLNEEEVAFLRATIAALKLGQEDTRRMDWLEKQPESSFIRPTPWRCTLSYYPTEVIIDYSVRGAIDSAISSTAKEEV